MSKNILTPEFFRDIESIQNHSDDMEEALERLVDNLVFSKVALFLGDSWSILCDHANDHGKDINGFDREEYKEILRPSLFLVVAGVLAEDWENLRKKDDYCEEYDYSYDCKTYSYLRYFIFLEIQRDLLDGALLWSSCVDKEEMWPAEEADPNEPDQDAFFDEEIDVEEDALSNILLEQVRGMVNDEEWDIITASHGDGPALAEKYCVTESAIRSRRQWVIERIRCELES